MKKQGKRTLTPKLRFPEFTEEWRRATIGEVFNSDDKPVKAARFEKDKILTVRLHANGVARNERTSALTGGSNYFTRRAGQFIFSKIDLLNGAFGIVPEEFDGFYSSSDVPAFSFGREHSPTFFLNWLIAKYRCLDIERTGTSATLKRVSPEKFWKLSIPLPSLPEQQKIAECLSSLDALISAEGRKLAALRDHKRGLMQQLFPQPGETQPRLRFPEFRDKGGWEEKAISELGEVITGSTPSTTRSEYYGGDRQFVSPADISELRFVRETKTTLTELGFQQTRPIKAKSVLFVCIGSTIGKIAQNLKDCATNQQINSIIAGPGISADFLYYLLSECSERIAMIAGNQAVPIINKSLFSGFKVLCPKEDEQHRIADCLTALDTQIAAQTAKIESLKQHKRGLMQQLFPAAEEV